MQRVWTRTHLWQLPKHDALPAEIPWQILYPLRTDQSENIIFLLMYPVLCVHLTANSTVDVVTSADPELFIPKLCTECQLPQTIHGEQLLTSRNEIVKTKKDWHELGIENIDAIPILPKIIPPWSSWGSFIFPVLHELLLQTTGIRLPFIFEHPTRRSKLYVSSKRNWKCVSEEMGFTVKAVT